MTVVLDASALLAAVLGEAGHEQLAELTEPGCVSAVNMAEARTRLIDHGMEHDAVENSLSLISKVVVDFTDGDAAAAAALRPATKAAGLSLGDRACLALAQKLEATALTADRQWASVRLPSVKIEMIR
jgi:PIN domain nuclease of toxin-antitoxin system